MKTLLLGLSTVPFLAKASSSRENDLLGRMYEDFDLLGGAQVRISAADSDVADAVIESQYMLPLDEMRKRIHNGGYLPDSGAAPGELSLALTDDPTVMRVSWATMDQVVDNPRVQLASPCTTDGCTYAATTTTYSVPQRWWPQFNGSLHTALVTGLVTGQKYSYRVGSDSPSPANQTASFSEYYSFNAPPALSSSTNIAILGDQGTVMPLGFAISEKLTAVQDELGIDAVIHVGDLCYAGIDTAFPHLNISKDDEFEWIWDLWQLQNQPIAATRPYMVGIGNHEAWYNWTAVTNRFHMPTGPTVGAEPPFWWSMDHGLVHWVHTCSEFPMDSDSPQGKWIAADLAAAAASAKRGQTPWIVLTLHRPPYSSENSWTDLRLDLEPLISQYKVDLVLSGHIHAYERTHAVGNNGVDIQLPNGKDENGNDVYNSPSFPIYITQGNSGAGQVERWLNPVPEWSATRWANGYTGSLIGGDGATTTPADGVAATLPGVYPYTYTDTFGFGVARFINSTAMMYESVPVTGNFTDKFWIVREVPN